MGELSDRVDLVWDDLAFPVRIHRTVDRSRPEFLAACHWRWAALMDTSFDVKGLLDPDVCL